MTEVLLRKGGWRRGAGGAWGYQAATKGEMLAHHGNVEAQGMPIAADASFCP